MDEQRARDAVEHLEAAVGELIAAGRAFLDAFEDVATRSDAGPSLFGLVESVAKSFGPKGPLGFPPFDPGADADDDAEDDDGDGDGDFEPIPVD